MKFGKVEDPGSIDFLLPKDHIQTKKILQTYESKTFNNVSVGCAKWNRKDLKNFYPRGTKEELTYYSQQFNSIELNATFYRMWTIEQFQTWRDKTVEDFKFFPKVPRLISHIKRLVDADDLVTDYTANLLGLGEKLGMVFLQMPENFHPKWIDRLPPFFEKWPNEIPLAFEVRHQDWHLDSEISDRFNAILKEHHITNVITDSAGRRDLLHMRLTSDTAFIRYNGANHPSDYTRLDDWVDRLEEWYNLGLKNVYFFVHQNLEEASPLLSAYFINKLNERFNLSIKIPQTL
ncbi:Uncharacterized conserved protein YecE, DUF72 family [Mesonia phycicola]|uniref:Uncharacterized conserved protein YecE, DUF72 family n=1 Tax=Mesonia phycicola TaxID=579105 RepID=A0A1M6BNR0_9FLAO|nr:DUF72 domain-containing protein [Mesonia phycicola]SHI50391.1 Uncharacterized conserved protein YecE, DUF72 family [Mesonia phycicola]